MNTFLTTWSGSFRYGNPLMPILLTTVTFEESSKNKFKGFLTEIPLIVPPQFKDSLDIPKPELVTAWGHVAGKIIDGKIHDEVKQTRLKLSFIKSPDQLTGHPIICHGAYNEAAGTIIGRWEIVEDSKSPLAIPFNLKSGSFSLSKINGRRQAAPLSVKPINPELLPA